MVMIDDAIPEAVIEAEAEKSNIFYDAGAFRTQVGIVWKVRDEFYDMPDAEKNKLGPVLDSLSRGMYALVKDVHEYGKSLPLEGQDSFSIAKDGLVMTAYSLFNFKNDMYKKFDDTYSAIINEKLSSDLHIPCRGILFLFSAFNIIKNNFEGSERDKAIELGDIVLRGIYHASVEIYDPETDPRLTISSGSDSDIIIDRDETLFELAESFKK